MRSTDVRAERGSGPGRSESNEAPDRQAAAGRHAARHAKHVHPRCRPPEWNAQSHVLQPSGRRPPPSGQDPRPMEAKKSVTVNEMSSSATAQTIVSAETPASCPKRKQTDCFDQ